MSAGARKFAFSVVGAGRVGTALGVMLARRGHTAASVVSSDTTDARSLGRRVKCVRCSNSLEDVSSESQLILLTVPDEAIAGVGERLADLHHLRFDRLHVGHTSGVLTSDVLTPLHSKGAKVFSLHPVQSFPKRVSLDNQLRSMGGIYYGYEGDPGSTRFAKKLVLELGGKFLQVPKEAKILYHLACVFASNYTVAALGVAEELSRVLGKGEGIGYLEKLIESSIENALKASPVEALTGPVVRGSSATVQLHLLELSAKFPELVPLYRELGRYVLRLAEKKNELTPEKIGQLKKILTWEGSSIE